jgi:hypothetical protein
LIASERWVAELTAQGLSNPGDRPDAARDAEHPARALRHVYQAVDQLRQQLLASLAAVVLAVGQPAGAEKTTVPQ